MKLTVGNYSSTQWPMMMRPAVGVSPAGGPGIQRPRRSRGPDSRPAVRVLTIVKPGITPMIGLGLGGFCGSPNHARILWPQVGRVLWVVVLRGILYRPAGAVARPVASKVGSSSGPPPSPPRATVRGVLVNVGDGSGRGEPMGVYPPNCWWPAPPRFQPRPKFGPVGFARTAVTSPTGAGS